MKSKRSTPSLPEEIIHYDILTKLPAKSLIRLKSVSKQWYNLINSKDFINLHRKRTLEFPTFDDMILIVPDGLQIRFYSNFDGVSQIKNIGMLVKASYAIIIGCCNGLICFKLNSGYFALRNPLSRSVDECRLIPPFDLVSRRLPSDTEQYGFGYDNLSQVYKIVNLRPCRFVLGLGVIYEVTVFSTGTGSWEVVEGFPLGSYIFCPGVSTNNKLHWIVNGLNKERGYVTNMDLHTHEFGEMSFPVITNASPWDGCDLIVSGGLLYLYMSLRRDDTTVAQIWVMKEYGVVESWTKLHSFARHDVPFCRMPTQAPYSAVKSQPYLPIFFKPLDNGAGQVLLSNNSELTWHNLEDKSTTELPVSDLSWGFNSKQWVCVTSLVQAK